MKLVCVRSRAVVELADGALPPYGVLSHTRDGPFLRDHLAVGLDFVGSDYDAPPPHYSPSPAASPPLPYSYISKNPSAPPKTKHQASSTFNNTKRAYKLNTRSTYALCGDALEQLCRHALRSGVEYVWIDEFCIDKTSTADLDDAVNGARRRLRNSAVCFAHLHDLPAATVTATTTMTTTTTSEADASAWSRCQYWKRAWTLQELILPPRVRFYDGQWNYRGDKDSPALAPLLSRITGIPRSILVDAAALADVALAVRISWSAGRAAAREEDTAYALVAVTGATLPVRYGEGAARAFFRLQEELLRDTRDASLLAWRSARGDDGEVRGLLARSPAEFGHFAATATGTAQEPQRPWVFNGKVRFSSKGIELESRVCKGPGCVLLSIGQKRQDLGTNKSIAICFREWNGVYVRVAPASRVSLSALRSWRSIDVMRDVDDSHSRSLRTLFIGMPCRIEMTKRGGGLEGAWRPALLPRVVQDSDEIVVQHEDHHQHHHQHQQADVKMEEGDEVMLPLSPQKSQTPSNHSDGSYVHIALAGSWMPSQEPPPPSSSSFRHPKDHDTYSDAGADEDVISSADSDPGSLTSNSASVTESDSGDDGNDGPLHHPYPVVVMKAASGGEANDDFDADAPATETRSTTTLAAEKDDDRDSLRSLVMQSAIRDHVLATSYQRVMAWIQTVTYVEPPQDRLPPRSRINPTDWFASAESLTLLCGDGDGDGDGPRERMVKVYRPNGYFHLSCPFFAADPAAHRSCVLTGRDLQTLAGVLAHVRAHHPPTAYCAFCHCDFAADYDARDAHMALRACEPVGHFAPQGDASRKGVPEAQLRRIEDKDRLRAARGKGEAERWRCIYRALFPDLVQRAASDDDGACDPYLRAGNGYAVSLAHDYWTLHKRECVAEALAACGHDIDELNDGEALEALYQTTLTALVTKIYHEWHLRKQEA